MALRKALTYSKKYARPYTRVSRVKSKAYIKVVPNNKVVKYSIGNLKLYQEKKLPLTLRMISDEPVQIRDTAIEAARQLLTKELDEKLPNNYYLELRIHPHHMLRNNKAAAGAGADRLSSGMSRAFGNIEGRAAIVRAGQQMFVVHCADEASMKVARQAFVMCKAKLPCKISTLFEKAPVVA